jgi:hypothetical protein
LNRTRCFASLRLVAAVLTLSLPFSAAAQNAPGPDLVIRGAIGKEQQFTLANLKQLSRTTVTAKDHDGNSHTYEGVSLNLLLSQCGVPQKGDLRGKGMSLAVLAEAADGYHVVFSLAELDTDFTGTQVLVADTVDGKPLAEKEGPLRLVVPNDKRPARWVRMLKSLRVVAVE